MEKIKSLKITTLAENLVQAGGLGQWGLSLLLDLEDAKGEPRRVVLDTGSKKDALLHNAKLLEEDFDDVDCVVLSHGHGDHVAATAEIVGAGGGVKVYGHPHTFLPRISENKEGKRRQVNPREGQDISDIEAAGGEVILSVNPVEVVPGLWTTGQVERATTYEEISPPPGGGKRIIVVDGEETDDQILDDLSLWADVEGVGPWVITGCAHSGPVNTILQVRRLGGFKEIFGLVGGTHLFSRSEEYLEASFRDLKEFGLRLVSPCHCTGFKATSMFMHAFPDEFVLNFNLRVIEAGKEVKNRLI
jgi:7,8-dihydropterin-6-yl-methyl-4-(beta-D-ribofuranosyl)aminobenzene 5'-phosphate synthase